MRDPAQGEPLKALLGVIAEQVAIVEEDLEQLYDEQFIETCAEWVVPYIGDLIGDRACTAWRRRSAARARRSRTRSAYRRRKGTAAMLEQLARDVTGWDARVVEFFEWLGWNQYMNHIRVDPARGGRSTCGTMMRASARSTPAERSIGPPARSMCGPRPRDPAATTFPTSGCSSGVSVPYTVSRTDARKIAKRAVYVQPARPRCSTVQSTAARRRDTDIADEVNVAHPLRRRVLHDELEASRLALAMNEAPVKLYFSTSPVFGVFLDGVPVAPEEIAICRLDEWRPIATLETVHASGRFESSPGRTAAVDPVLGRLICLPRRQPDA